VTPPAALEASGVTAWRGPRLVLEALSLTVAPGEAVFVVGANGTGRSTLVAALGGLVPRRGRVCVGGRLIPPGRPAAAVRAGLAVVPERRQLFPTMSVEENLLLGLFTHGFRTVRAARRAPELAAVYQRLPVLAERRSQRAGTLSGGEQQLLALGRALVGRPAVLLLDEPFLGLAPGVADTIVGVVGALRAEGCGLLVVDDDPGRVAALADGVLTLPGSQVVTRTSSGLPGRAP